MNQNLWSHILEILKRRLWNKRWHRVLTCLAAAVVFGTTYALILPAITMTKVHPTLAAEQTLAWSGDGLAVKVTAEAEADGGMKTFVLIADGEGADLSKDYAFNEEGICIITDDAGNEIELHRSIRKEDELTAAKAAAAKANSGKLPKVDYWFTLEAGSRTEFTLDLMDEVDESRFAETVEALKQNTEAEKATASDAGKSETAAETATVSNASANAGNAQTASGATVSNAVKMTAAGAAKASGSNADIEEANALARTEEEQIATEKDEDSSFVEILDGAVVDDLDHSGEEDEEQTEIVAKLLLSAGIGSDYKAAVDDAEKGADKRGDAQLMFQWKDVIAKKAADPSLVSYVNGATIAVFYDEKAGIPEGAELAVEEIEEDSEEYEAYLSQTKAAMGNATASNAAKDVTQARFFDITILDADGNAVEPAGPVKVVITYDNAMLLEEEDDLNVVHFKDEAPEVFKPASIDGGKDVEGLSFTADSFSVYGIFGMGTLKAGYLAADGETYRITVNYGPEAEIPDHAFLYVREVEGDELAAIRAAVEKEQSADINVALSRTFDIKILDADGHEIQPAESSQVKVTFELEEAGDENLSASVYHMCGETDGEYSALELAAETKDKEVTVLTDGFSYYYMEFTYDQKTYVMSGSGSVTLATVRTNTGLTGAISGARTSSEAIQLTEAGTNPNYWTISVPEPFSTTEQLFLTIGGTEYQINVICEALPPAYDEGTKNGVRQYGDNRSFLHGCETANTFILEERMKNPVVTYDPRFSLVYDGATHIVYRGALQAGTKTTFEGTAATLLYKNAAILPNGTLGDIELTFSDVSFFTQPSSDGSGYRAEYTKILNFDNSEFFLPRVESGNDGTANLAVGLEVTVETRILEKDGTAVKGNYYYGMMDIDIPRDPAQNAGKVIEAADHYYFSEQVEIVSGAQSVAYIPAASDLSGSYLCGISNNTGDDANGLIFTPTLGTPDPGEYGSGFATLADAEGFTIKVRSASIRGAVNTTVSPGSIGGLWVRKEVIDGTEWDYSRNWEMAVNIDGTTFTDSRMKHGETAFVGAFTRDYQFTAKETLPNDWQDYETSWRVKAVEINDQGKAEEVTKDSGTGVDISGIIYPKTIIEYNNKRLWVENELTVKKVVQNPRDAQDLQRGFQFTLFLYDGTSENPVPIKGIQAPEGAQNWRESGNGYYEFTLKHGETLQLKLPKSCSYKVQETDDPGFITVYENQQGTLTNVTVATVTNIPKPKLTVKKVDENGQFVPGARFKLLRKNEAGQYVKVEPPAVSAEDFEVPENGYRTGQMDLGDYKLVETKAPNGYIILTQETEFELKLGRDGKPVLTLITQTGDVSIDNETLTVTVKNEPGTSLPNTGGPGAWNYILSGLALMLGTALVYGFGRRRIL